MSMADIKKYIAEFVGTFVLVLFGCGSAVAANALYSVQGLSVPLAFTTLTISVSFGLCIVAMAYSIGNVSGCHINPAVSIGCFVAGRMTVKDLIGYLIAQFAGGFCGAFTLSKIISSKVALGQNGYGESSALGISAPIAVLVEVILTFVFVMVILSVTSKPEYSSVAGLVIGLTLTLIHIFGIPFTGTSVNPARSFGPAVLVGGDALSQLPVFIAAPIIGAVLAAIFFTYVLNTPAEEPEEVEEETEEEAEEAAEAEDVESDEGAQAIEETDEEVAPEEDQGAETEETPVAEKPSGKYNAIDEMMIETEPESVAEAEAAVIEEADSEALI